MHAFAHPEHDKRVAVGIVVLVALAAGTLAGVDGPADPAGRIRRDPAVLAPDGRLARRAQHRLAAGARAGGARRAVRHPGVGHQPRRAVAGARRQPVGRARLDSADPAADHPRTGFGAAAVRRRTAVRRTGGYPCPARHFLCRSAQRPGSGDVAVGTAGAGAPRDRRIRRACQGGAVRRPGRSWHARGVHHRQRAAAEIPGRGDLPGRNRRPSRAPRISPTPTRWPASTAGPRRCCGSTSGAGC